MTRIESRPARASALWEYIFFIDVEGHQQDARCRAPRSPRSKARAPFLKMLGSYPVASK